MTPTTERPDPGIYHNVPFEEYLTWPYVNNSSLGPLEQSPAHYLAGQGKDKESDAFRIGRFTHSGVLEPKAVMDRYVVLDREQLAQDILRPDGTAYANVFATAEYKRRVAQFAEQHAGQEIVTQDEYDMILEVVHQLWSNDRAKAWLGLGCKVEVSLVWDDPLTGLRCKGRVDALNERQDPPVLCDVKTCQNAADFSWALWKWRYHRQAAFYLDGYRAVTGNDACLALIAVEKQEPFGVRAAPVGPATIAAGRQLYREALSTIANCRQANSWPGYQDPESWDIPETKLPPVELSISGHLVLV